MENISGVNRDMLQIFVMLFDTLLAMDLIQQFPDYYKIIGVDSNASLKEINYKYRNESKRLRLGDVVNEFKSAIVDVEKGLREVWPTESLQGQELEFLQHAVFLCER